jgi:opacity protein-like surface antigen
VDINLSTARDSLILFSDPTLTTAFKGFGTLRGRLGTLIQPTTLLYLTAGGALGHFTHTWIEPGDVPDSWQDFAQWRFGWVVGAGIEHAFSPAWTARLEVLYMDFGSYTSTNPLGFRMTVTDTATIVRGAFNWRY